MQGVSIYSPVETCVWSFLGLQTTAIFPPFSKYADILLLGALSPDLWPPQGLFFCCSLFFKKSYPSQGFFRPLNITSPSPPPGDNYSPGQGKFNNIQFFLKKKINKKKKWKKLREKGKKKLRKWERKIVYLLSNCRIREYLLIFFCNFALGKENSPLREGGWLFMAV